MTRKKRRVIFYALTVLFVIAGPLIAAYALGFVFDFSRAGFQKTGGIFIKSVTPRLSVFLDGAFMKETGILAGSALLLDMTPGRHLVRLEKDGYIPWSKTVMVEPSAVTELRGVLLTPRLLTPAASGPAEWGGDDAAATSSITLILNKKGDVIAGTGRAARTVLKNVHTFAAFGDTIWFVDKNGFFARSDETGEQITTIGRPGFFLGPRPFRFFSGRSAIAVIDSSEGLFTFDRDAGRIRAVTANVENISFDSEEKKLLVRADQGLAILWLEDNPRQPFQEKGTLEEIIKSDALIRDAAWLYRTDAHIAYRTRDGIFLTEIDARGGRNTVPLVSGATDELFTRPALPEALFWRKGKNVYKIEL